MSPSEFDAAPYPSSDGGALSDGGPTPAVLPGPVVGPRWLAAHLGEAGIVVLDASMPVVGGESADDGAARAVVPGALRFDIEGPFSDPASGLPHTMPAPEAFHAAVRALGAPSGAAFVVYDDQGIYSSARAWWMLTAMGYDAAVLDGGLPGWIAAGGATVPPENDGAAPSNATANDAGRATEPHPGWFVDADDVARALADPSAVVLDARSAPRFDGAVPEPRAGLRSGHMPGAVNLPFTDLLDGGFLRPRAELDQRVSRATGGADRIVTSCGSGVTAAVPALVCRLLGRDDVAIYDGSWAEWGLPGDRPVVTTP